MSRPALTLVANDNDPLERRPEGDAAGYRAMLRERQLERRLQALELSQLMQGNSAMPYAAQHAPLNSQAVPNWGLVTALLCTFVATIAAAFCFYANESFAFKTMSLMAMVWSALWAVFFSTDSDEPIAAHKSSGLIAEICIVIATVSGLMIWILTSREWGLALSAADGTAGFAMLAALVTALLRSRLSLLMSVCAGLAWLGLYTQIPSINLISIWTYPVLAIVQIFLAGQDDAKFSACLALIGAYSWLAWILSDRLFAGDISTLHLAAIAMMIGLAHYRLGKAAGDVGWASAGLNTGFGWTLAVSGAVALQIFWLGGDMADAWQMEAKSPMGDLSWQIIGAVSIFCVGLAGVIRMAYKQMSSLAVLFSLAVALAAAAVFDQQDIISSFVQNELNMSAKPIVGLIIGAAIFASAIAMCLNGARRKSWGFMLIGLAAIAVQLTLLLDARHWTIETSLAFALGLGASLCFAALFAADRSADHA